MPVTVEQCGPAEMTTLTNNTLELFSTFKSQDEEKDSDEESFHLPLLECDDDAAGSPKGDAQKSDVKEGAMEPEENEDEILNKFDLAANTPEPIDPNLEESLLNGKDDTKEDAQKKDGKDILAEDSGSNADETKDKSNQLNDETSKEENTIKKVDDIDTETDKTEEKLLEEVNEEPVENEENSNENMEIDTSVAETDSKEEETEKMDVIDTNVAETDSKQEETEKMDTEESDDIITVDSKIDEQEFDSKIDEKEYDSKIDEKEYDSKIDEKEDDSKIDTIVSNSKIDSEEFELKIDTDEPEKDEKTDEDKGEEPMTELRVTENIDNAENSTESTAENSTELTAENSKELTAENSKELTADENNTNFTEKEDPEKMDKDIIQEVSKTDEKECTIVTESSTDSTENKESDESEIEKKDDASVSSANSKTESENTSEQNADASAPVGDKTVEEETASKLDFPEPSSSPNLDSDDLLDISIIRNQDEDDAHLADICNEASSDNYQDENSDEKTENEEDVETVIVSKDDTCSSEKASEATDVEHMEMEDEDFVDEHEKEHDDDIGLQLESDKAEEHDFIMPLVTKTVSEKDEDEKSNVECPPSIVEESSSEKPETERTSGKDNENRAEMDLDSDKRTKTIEEKMEDEVENDDEKTPASVTELIPDEPSTKSSKRLLSEGDESSVATKKIRLSPEVDSKYNIKSLINLSDFMKNKRLKKLTRSDLEEFCVQKICEVIVHKSEIGEINQQLRVHEQMVEQLRKDQQQLHKQVRDLEIVNKKLMQELKSTTNPKKPLIPLKITRSVGLQVKLAAADTAVKRRPVPQQLAQKPAVGSATRVQRPIAVANTVSPRQLATASTASPQKTSTTPILSSVLQTRRQTTPVKLTNQVRVKPTENKGGSVIDLTDEDDKKNESQKKTETVKKAVLASVAGGGRTVATIGQGVRLATPAQVKTTPITGVVTSSAPQLMYVLQPGTQIPSGVITTAAGGAQKAVLLNFQSNGLLTSPTLNGSAVSVIPKATTAIQPKQVIRPSNKHPAPLPVPPLVRVTGEKNMKPVPPKPHLTIRKTDTGIILQWRMPYDLDLYEVIASYQLYAYQETSSAPSTDMWRRVGDVKALALPMACTLTQFADKNKYYFAVRPVDVYKRIGAFSDPEEISL